MLTTIRRKIKIKLTITIRGLTRTKAITITRRRIINEMLIIRVIVIRCKKR